VGLLPANGGRAGPASPRPRWRFIEETVVRGEELDAERLVERIAERFGLRCTNAP
jgi:hypothetical protein